MEKILFALEIDDDNGWPPVGAEGVWCERIGDDYKLLNAPFFIKGLAYGDVFAAEPDPVNEQIFEFEVTEESGHSVVWVMNNSDVDTAKLKQQILALGCSVEGFDRFQLWAIDVPPSVDRVTIKDLLDSAEALGLDLAFPVWRHEV